jgi:hypothetical protein
MSVMMKKKIKIPTTNRRLEGQIVRIDLKDGTHAYGRVLKRPLFAFYDKVFRDDHEPSLDEIEGLPVAFRIDVMDYVIPKGIWPVVGRRPLTPDLERPPTFYKQDPMSGALSIYQEVPELAPYYERAATYEECLGLEVAAVWDPQHVEERLRDHFAGRVNRWVERARQPEDFKTHQEQIRHRKKERKLEK